MLFYDNTLGFLTGAVIIQGRKTKIFYLRDWNFSYCNLSLGFHSIILIHPKDFFFRPLFLSLWNPSDSHKTKNIADPLGITSSDRGVRLLNGTSHYPNVPVSKVALKVRLYIMTMFKQAIYCVVYFAMMF